MKRRIVIHTASAACWKINCNPTSSQQSREGGGQAMLNPSGSPLWFPCTETKHFPVPHTTILPATRSSSERATAGKAGGQDHKFRLMCSRHHECACGTYKGLVSWLGAVTLTEKQRLKTPNPLKKRRTIEKANSRPV